MSKIDRSPVALPAGSFELSELEDAAKEIQHAKAGERDSVAAAALGKINNAAFETVQSNLLPGHRFEEVERAVDPGVEVPAPTKDDKDAMKRVDAVTVKETIQVFDEKKAEDEAAAAEEPALSGAGAATDSALATGASTAATGGRSGAGAAGTGAAAAGAAS